MKTVRNLNTLKAMARLGFITFCDQTGEKICGLYSNRQFTCYYVDSGSYNFEYKGKKYGIKYFDGCFNPYVMQYK